MPNRARVTSGLVLLLLLTASATTVRANTTTTPTPPPTITTNTTGACAPLPPAPKVRQVPELTIDSPAQTAAPPPGLRLRTHVRANDHRWFGPEVPLFIPLEAGNNTALDLLDQVDGGNKYVALYRERFATCGVGVKDKNCAAEVRIFDCNGQTIASASLNAHMSRPTHLEVQDIHYADGTLYFNEACQSYSSEAGGRCSALVALDPIAKKVLWRTSSLSSNNWFVINGDYIIAAYGFTAEPATIRVVRRKDGAVMDKQKLQGTNFEMVMQGDILGVDHWNNIGRVSYKMTGFDGATPKLVRIR